MFMLPQQPSAVKTRSNHFHVATATKLLRVRFFARDWCC